MLVLSRKSGEEVLVPQYGIALKILEIHGNQVRVGVTGPDGVRFYRGELWLRVQQGKLPETKPVLPPARTCSPRPPS